MNERMRVCGGDGLYEGHKYNPPPSPSRSLCFHYALIAIQYVQPWRRQLPSVWSRTQDLHVRGLGCGDMHAQGCVKVPLKYAVIVCPTDASTVLLYVSRLLRPAQW